MIKNRLNQLNLHAKEIKSGVRDGNIYNIKQSFIFLEFGKFDVLKLISY